MTQSTHSPTIHALIVAAGKGTRFGAKQAKQYQMIDLTNFGVQIRQTVLQFSVAVLAQQAQIKHCTLIVAQDDVIAQTLDFAMPCDLVMGGQTRFDSVKAGLKHIASQAQDGDYVLIHDAARPCVCPQDIQTLICQAMNAPNRAGAILAHPVADTLKLAKSTQNAMPIINHSISREQLWQALTPQIFHIKRLLTAIDELPIGQDAQITDEASVFELSKKPQMVLLVQGKRSNIKLTYLDDLPMVQAILAQFWMGKLAGNRLDGICST